MSQKEDSRKKGPLCTAFHKMRKTSERRSYSVCLWVLSGAAWPGVCQGLGLEVEAQDVCEEKQRLLGGCPEERAKEEQDKPIEIAAIIYHSLSKLLNTPTEHIHPS